MNHKKNMTVNLTESYIRLIYTSLLYEQFNNGRTIKEIVNISQKNNATYNIGGELTWFSKKGKIMQILEGPILNVNHLINIIKCDKRHTNIQIIACVDITKEQAIYELWSAQFILPDSPCPIEREPRVNDYQILSIIGSGGFSTVVKALNTENKQYYALKIMTKKRQTNNSIRIALTERNVWKNINNSLFINKLHYCLQDPLNVYFVMDYAPRGDMFDVVKNYKLNESDCIIYFTEILCGLKTIHGNNIIYRDLKLENILIDQDGHVLLTDFGISNHLDELDQTIRGTPMYFAPEIIKEKVIHQKNDIWSLGIILFEMTGIQIPWQGLARQQMFHVILSQQLTLNLQWSENLNELLQLLTIHDYNTRPNCESIVSFLLEKNLINSWEDVCNKTNCVSILPEFKSEITNEIIEFSL